MSEINDNTPDSTFVHPRKIFNRAGNDGIIVGAYLSGLALMTGFSVKVGLFSILVWVFSLYLPFFVYRLISRGYKADGYRSRFSDLWAQGISTFFFASIILAAVVYVCLRFIAPHFIADQFAAAMALFNQTGTPEGMEIAETLKRVSETNSLPTASDVSMEMIVFNLLVGTVISLFCAAILKLSGRKKK